MTGAPVLRSGLVLDLEELLPGVAEVRRRISPGAVATGIPLHVTVLFPFAPAAAVAGHLPELTQLLRSLEPVTVTLERVAVWPGVVYAEPAPSPALRELMETVIEAHPSFPPYGGEHPDPVPHATLAVTEPGDESVVAARAESALSGLLPASSRVDAVTVMGEREPDRWQPVERLPLGTTS